MTKKFKSTGVKISAVAHFLPETIMTNQDIIEKYNLRLKDQWVKDNIGIHQRHWCQNNESASDLGTEVLSILLEKEQKNLSALIVSTVSQDFMTPATATILQNNVTPGQTYPVFDLTAACSGFIYAIDTARRLVQTGHEKVACVATEIRSYYLNKKDRRTVMLFGDGAGGVTLSPCADGEIGIIDSKLLADGRHYNSIVVTGSGSQRVKEEDPKDIVEMRDAVKIFGSAVEEMKNLVNEMLEKHGLNIYDINYFIIHQASKVIVEKVAEALDIPKEKYILNFPDKGNMTSASTAVALSEAVEQGKINKGDIVLMLATGGGFTAGVTLFRWEL